MMAIRYLLKNIIFLSLLILLVSGCRSQVLEQQETLPPAAPTLETPTFEPTVFPFTSVNIYLIALDDNGQNGEKVGCNDSVVPVAIDIEPNNDPITAALTRLLDMDKDYLDQSGLYNVFHQSDLHIDSIQIEDKQATINLTGTLMLGGVCDDPRVLAQLEHTVLQFENTESVLFFINDEPLESVLSEK